AAVASGAQAVEIHTGAYADASDKQAERRELQRITAAAAYAAECGLEVHAGHGLHAGNVGPVAALSPVVELNIGHALVARSVFIGLGAAIQEMRDRMDAARDS